MDTTEKSINPSAVKFIKLGERGKWQNYCIEVDHTIRLGFESNQHQECLDKNWMPVRSFWLSERNGNERQATNDLREIQAFYELPSTVLWITFHNRLLYWCFAEEKVTELDDGSRVRKAINGWSCKSLAGETLHVENIDGRVTKVQGYRRTICNVDRADYLIRKIRGNEQPEVFEAKDAFDTLCNKAAVLIEGLWWHDFEVLADLIFTRAGWQRVSVLGKTEKDIDLDLLSPVTNRRAFVQVKSSANYDAFNDSVSFFRNSGIYDEMYFVVHTIEDKRLVAQSVDGVTVLDIDDIAKLSINSGLMTWLIKKRE
jgi:hypothetical protein